MRDNQGFLLTDSDNKTVNEIKAMAAFDSKTAPAANAEEEIEREDETNPEKVNHSLRWC